MAAAMQEGFLPLDRHRGRHDFGPSETLVSSSREKTISNALGVAAAALALKSKNAPFRVVFTRP